MDHPRVVSIVIPTCDRLLRLQSCVAAIREQVTRPVEIIVVDGASSDGTGEWLARQKDLTAIREPVREGAVRSTRASGRLRGTT